MWVLGIFAARGLTELQDPPSTSGLKLLRSVPKPRDSIFLVSTKNNLKMGVIWQLSSAAETPVRAQLLSSVIGSRRRAACETIA
jgi:hypothetical protein